MTATMPDVAESDTEPAQPAEPAAAAEQIPGVDDVVSPAEADTGGTDALELRGTGGALTLLPGQRDLDARQAAALKAIGIDSDGDPGVKVHIRPFIHMCQVRGLDPYAREAYLIGRGKGDNRKWTMQVGIDGYLKIAKSTGQFKRIAEVLWTGKDDDPGSWREVVDARGRLVMHRVWWNQWPAERGEPGAAMAMVEHYDDHGVLTETEAIADWGMYAPYTDKWVDDPAGGTNRWGKPKTIKKIGADGKPEQELSAMWTKGASHMLAKCAIALAMRRAFPAKMSGMYLHEEMHQADAVERRRQEAEASAARVAYVQSQRAERAPANGAAPASEGDSVDSVLSGPSFPDTPDIIDGEGVVVGSGPVLVGEVLAAAQATMRGATKPEPSEDAVEAEAAPEADEETQREWLLAELAMQGEVVGSTPAALARRWVAKAKKNVEAFTRDELLAMVAALRPMVIGKMLEDPERIRQADVYRQIADNVAAPVEWLLGLDLAAGK